MPCYTQRVRRLIVNADDFGLTAGVNRAIAQAHNNGVVTSATLMAAGSCFEDAVGLARGLPKLSVGCHVVLIDGSPLQPASKIATLIATQDGERGQFRNRLSSFAAAALTGRIHAAQVEVEATGQIRKIQSAGISVSHVDTHKHTHLFPAVLAPLLRAARACGIRTVRNPFVIGQAWPGYALRKPGLLKRFVQVQVLRGILSSRFREEVKRSGLATPDGSFGIVETGYLSQLLLDPIIDSIPDGTWELVCHPGYVDAELTQVNTRLQGSRLQELELLTSPATRERLAQRGIQLISYNDFASGLPA